MLRVGLIMLVLGGLLGYGIAFARFGDAKVVDELRTQHSSLIHDYESSKHQLREYSEQNKVLKDKAQKLMIQNEDYAKIVSELSRYQYHLEQASEKVAELVEIVGTPDADLGRKIEKVQMGGGFKLDMNELDEALESTREKRFF